jgi:uncharacterized protein (TIGR03083 family)
MDRDTYLAHLARDGARMAELARGDLDAQVPTCPDWKLRDLIEHTGMVHRWQTEAARHDSGSFPDPAVFQVGPADGQALADWFQVGVDNAIVTMSKVDATEPRWTWAKPDGGDLAQWYFRRIAQETVVHRLDAELTAGKVTGVDPAFAVDGVDEVIDVFLPFFNRQPIGGDGETLHLHATDAEGEWLLTFHADRISAARGHAKGDAAIRATARDLLLVVWGRDAIGATETFGDQTVIERFRTLPR